MITKIRELPRESNEEIALKGLIKNFNEEAKKQNSAYYIKKSFSGHPFLYTFFFGINQIVYLSNGEFCFVDGINKKLYNKLKPILENIPEKWHIDIRWSKKMKFKTKLKGG